MRFYKQLALTSLLMAGGTFNTFAVDEQSRSQTSIFRPSKKMIVAAALATSGVLYFLYSLPISEEVPEEVFEEVEEVFKEICPRDFQKVCLIPSSCQDMWKALWNELGHKGVDVCENFNFIEELLSKGSIKYCEALHYCINLIEGNDLCKSIWNLFWQGPRLHGGDFCPNFMNAESLLNQDKINHCTALQFCLSSIHR